MEDLHPILSMDEWSIVRLIYDNYDEPEKHIHETYFLALSPNNSLYFTKSCSSWYDEEDDTFDACEHNIMIFKKGCVNCDYDGIIEHTDGRIDVHFTHGIEHFEKVSSIPIELSPIIIKCAGEMREELTDYIKYKEESVIEALNELSKSRQKVREMVEKFKKKCINETDAIEYRKKLAEKALALANSRIGFNPSGTYDYNVVDVTVKEETNEIKFVGDGKTTPLSGRIFCKVLKTPKTTIDIYDRVKHDVIVMNSSCFRDTHARDESSYNNRYLYYSESIQVNSKFAIIIIDEPLRKIEISVLGEKYGVVSCSPCWNNTWVLIRDRTLNMAIRSSVFIVGAKASELKTELSDRLYYSKLNGGCDGSLRGSLDNPLSIPNTAEDDGYMVSCKISPENVRLDPCLAFHHLLEEFNIVEPK